MFLTACRSLKAIHQDQFFNNIYEGAIAFGSSHQKGIQPYNSLSTPINHLSLWSKLLNLELVQESRTLTSAEPHGRQQKCVLTIFPGSFRDWITSTFLEITNPTAPSSWATDSVEYKLAFRGIQSIPKDASKRQRDEIFTRVLQILTSNRIPPSATTKADHINLLTRNIAHISNPFILLKAGLDDVDESFREGNINDEAPLVALANSLDSSQGIKLDLAPLLALRLLAEVTIKYVILAPKMASITERIKALHFEVQQYQRRRGS